MIHFDLDKQPLPPEVNCLIRLWQAVLLAAVEDLKSKDRFATVHWFLDCRQEPGSFEWVCQVVGLSPDWVRAKALGVR